MTPSIKRWVKFDFDNPFHPPPPVRSDASQLPLFELALQSATAAGDASLEGSSLAALGRIQMRAGTFDAAVATFARAKGVYAAVGDKKGEGRACFALAEAYERVGNLAGAQQMLESFFELASATSDSNGQVRLVFNFDGVGEFFFFLELLFF
jgi:tetratricopeptide (TPR) repeat protein